jgi:hypothetical protein
MSIVAGIPQLDYLLKNFKNGQMTSISFICPLEELLSLGIMEDEDPDIQKKD